MKLTRGLLQFDTTALMPKQLSPKLAFNCDGAIKFISFRKDDCHQKVKNESAGGSELGLSL